MELMNEDDPQMLQQQADEAAIKANRGGTPNRTLMPGSTIQDLGMQSVAQMKDFSKFNSMAMMLGDLDKDGKMSSYETARQKAIEKNMNK
mgnify:FL=1|tara:strand:+ start:132 stop:401 length:270 start_codon:yes stop_codon:yes gene_type:complete